MNMKLFQNLELLFNHYMYIYIYIERERESESENEHLGSDAWILKMEMSVM